MDYTALATEINTDPLTLGYAALVSSGSDQGIAILLNANNYTLQGPVPMTDVFIWLGENALTVTIQGIAATSGPLQNNAATFLLAVQGGSAVLDVTNSAIVAMVAAFVTAGTFTQSVQDALFAMGQVPASRAEVLFGSGVSVSNSDVSFALRGQ